MDAWIPITIAAAFFQNLRSAVQRHLKGQLSNTGATFSRFAYAAPLAILYVTALAALSADELPRPNAAFVVYAVIGGLAQITATALDNAACEFGSSREELLLALFDEDLRRKFEQEHGVDPRSVTELGPAIFGL